MRRLLVIGDALLDRDVSGRVRRICADAPVPVLEEERSLCRPGGAGLAAALAAEDGREVTLLTGLAEDGAGRELGRLLAERGVELVDIGARGTTREKVRLRCGGQTLLRVDRGGERTELGELSAAGRAAIGWAGAILVSDYGGGMAAHEGVRESLRAAKDQTPLVWDPHPRGPEPVAGVRVATPNEAESELFAPGCATPGERGARLVERWGAERVCVTRGARGALLCAADGPPRGFPVSEAAGADGGPRGFAELQVGGTGGCDPCGAGDRFASALAGALADGRDPEAAVREAVGRASAFVCAGGAAGWMATQPARPAQPVADHAVALAERVRARGGTVVAAGGCFDLLHTGHVQMLGQARALGDCLIVCVNSDASVRRLKGAERPLVGQEDRAAVLAALGCVDGVMVFEQDTPVGAIERLRPHVWAKGGDYRGRELPEREVLDRWGGRVVTLPYVDGHSTSGLLKEVAFRVAD